MSKISNMIFRRYGRSYHLKIETAEDLEHAAELDEAHWVATSAPLETINCDKAFLQLLDANNSGRIMCREVKDAIRWLLNVLCNHAGITARSKTLRLNSVAPDAPQGQQIQDAAKEILRSLGEKDAEKLTLEHVRQVKTQVESMPVSEAGVVLPEAAADAEIRQFLSDILETVGGTAHPSGAQGVGSAQLTSFVAEARAYLNWYEQGQLPPGEDKTDIMPLGSDTSSAYEIFASIRGKIDQYFAQCVALSLDERFGQLMGWTDSELQNLDFDDIGVIEQVLKKAPLARATPDQLLRFKDKINPHYAETLDKFRRQVIEPVLGKQQKSLSTEQWQQIKSFFDAHHSWVQAKAGAIVEPLGIQKLQNYLDERFANAVRSLISDSTRTASMLDKIRLLEKVILYQAYMIEFVNNFVSFPHLYDTSSRAMFEMGSLVMDGRRFNLSVQVGNRAEHKAVANNSSMYVLYVEIARDGTNLEVAVPVTSGGKGNLSIGKRGVFYDMFGNECDAKVVDIIVNPISVTEALVSPFQRLGRLLVGKIESITTTAEKKLDTKASSALDQMAAKPGASEPAPTRRSAIMGGGLLMGAGVAVAALGSAVAYITKTLAEINSWAVIIAILVAVLAVMLPISIVAFLKLRRRDLSAILEGSGWGINARMRMTHKQSRYFTQKPQYPDGSKGVHHFPWRLLLVLLLLLAAVIAGLYLLREHRGDSQPSNTDSTLSQPVENK